MREIYLNIYLEHGKVFQIRQLCRAESLAAHYGWGNTWLQANVVPPGGDQTGNIVLGPSVEV